MEPIKGMLKMAYCAHGKLDEMCINTYLPYIFVDNAMIARYEIAKLIEQLEDML